MEKITAYLKENQYWDQIVKQELGALWKYGVERITDTNIKEAVIDFLENVAPVGFFVNPASASHKYHPRWQCKKSGILRNTTECCLLVDRFLQNDAEFCNEKGEVLSKFRDIVLAATILSDTFKYGYRRIDPENPQSGLLNREHGKIAAGKWRASKKALQVQPEIREAIYEAIYWHVGRWTPGWTPGLPISKLTYITHTIDIVLTEKSLEIAFDAKEVIE